MLEERPAGALGPRYTVAYVMPGPNNERDTLVQELYPYARPAPVSYVEPGQRFWTTEETRGGWFVASPNLRDLLVTAGLPATPPAGRAAPSDSPWTVLGPMVALVALGAVGAVAATVVVRRRRPEPV
jgi:hypothetical protein